jgi:hypothetical protein
MERRYRQEKIFKCLYSRKIKPCYFEPWFLPKCTCLIFRILLLVYSSHVWLQRELKIDSLKSFLRINGEMTVISNEAVIAYCLLGIKHYYSENKMDSTLTKVLSWLWTFCILYENIATLVFWTVLSGNISYYTVSAHGVLGLLLLIPLLFEFPLIRWSYMKWLVGVPLVLAGGIVLPLVGLYPELDHRNIG